MPPSDEQQLASRKAAQQFWASTSSWEDTPPSVQEQARKAFGIKVFSFWPNVRERKTSVPVFLQRLQPKYLKKYSIHTVKTEVSGRGGGGGEGYCVLMSLIGYVLCCSFTHLRGERGCGVLHIRGVKEGRW